MQHDPIIETRAEAALRELEASIAQGPKPQAEYKGPRPTPIPRTCRKRKRLIVRASRRANR